MSIIDSSIRLIDFFVDSNEDHIYQKIKHRLLVASGFLAILFSSLNLFVDFITRGKIPDPLVLLFILCYASVPFLSKMHVSYNKLVHIFLFPAILAILFSSINTPEYQSTMRWLAIIPVVATYLLNTNSAIIYSILSFIFILISNYKVEVHSGSQVYDLWHWFLILLGICLFTGLHKWETQEFMLESTKANQKLQTAIDELKKKEEIIKEAQMQLIQDSKMSALGVMASGIAHEINNPLEVILGFTQVLIKNDNIDGEQDLDNLGYIETAAFRIREIINQIKILSHKDSTDGKKPILINTVLSDIFNEQKQLYPNIPFKISISQEKIDTLVHINKTKFNSVVTNLIKNSVDSIMEKTSISSDDLIHIKSNLEGNQLVISIVDSGKGIPNEIIDNVFDPFFTTKEVGKGTGLGLSISYEILKEMKGSIRFNIKNVNEGAEVIIRLPIFYESKKTSIQE